MDIDSKNKGFRVDSKTITEFQSESLCPYGRCGPLVARIPVIISQSRVHININSEVYFENSVLNILSCTRNAFLTQCKLLDMGNKRHGKVHINGYINENIEYTVQSFVSDKYVNTSEVCYKTIKIPFEFAAKIEYCSRPVFETTNKFLEVSLGFIGKSSSNSETDILKAILNQHYDLSVSKERLFCELEEATICEADIIKKNTRPTNDTNATNTFDSLTEYMIMSITFTLLQWQQVSIPRYLPYNSQ